MIIALVFMLFTLIALIVGVMLMARGGKLNQRFSNKMMVIRVITQFAVIVIFGLIYFFNKKQ